MTRREWLRSLGSVGTVGLLASVTGRSAYPYILSANDNATSDEAEALSPSAPMYSRYLLEAAAAMVEGKHPDATISLRSALEIDRNEPYGILLLATLCLHAGNTARAAREFQRATVLFPQEPLARWGFSLTELARGKPAPVRDAGSVETRQVAELLSDYVELLHGDPAAIYQQTYAVTDTEPDSLRLEIAAFAAIRSGNPERGTALLRALLTRPQMRGLNEAQGVLLPFLAQEPVQGGATAPLSRLQFPPAVPGPPLSGKATLTPPKPLPDGTAMVLYRIEGGGGYTATTNYPPFTTVWNTMRYPNGVYTVFTAALDTSGHELARRERTVMISNPDAPVPLLLTPRQQTELRRQLTDLLTPHPTKKAAHFALAEHAVKRGDSNTALAHIESVVAIDPLYRNARETLKRYNRKVIGEREGIWCGVTKERLVALTFDDGPDPVRCPRLLDALKSAGAVGTFFVVGARAEQSPELLQRMDEEGHELANHSYSHPNLTFMDRYNIERELCRTSVLIREAIGKRPRFFRPPGGNNNSTVVDAAELLGMAGAYWTLDGLKFENRPFTPNDLTYYILQNIRPGAIVLLHNAPDNTIAAIPRIVRGLKAKGYKMVTMSELVRRAKPGGRKDAKVSSRYTVKE
ncbi:MAG: hypothetical protein OHK0029_07740 [Armatimonadaceae bacterium]